MLMGLLRRLFQETVVPELRQIRAENAAYAFSWVV